MHNLITLTNYRTRIALHALAGKPTNVTEATPRQVAPGAAPALDAIPEDARQQFLRPADQLVHYLLFANEEPLPELDAAAIKAESAFAREFAARGPRDAQGRSLRDFDLHTRIFRFPCSYLIYSDAFDALPEPAKGYVYHRLLEVLSGKDESGDFDALSAPDRRAVLEILLQTKPGLPREWRDYARANGLRIGENS